MLSLTINGRKVQAPEGCTILVKLRQMDPEDQDYVRIDTKSAPWQPSPVEGAQVMPLFERKGEGVALWQLAPGTRLPRHEHPGGEETFVLDGVLEDELGRYPKGAWLRNPPGSAHAPFSAEGCRLYVKTGHLG